MLTVYAVAQVSHQYMLTWQSKKLTACHHRDSGNILLLQMELFIEYVIVCVYMAAEKN